ncbi:hypothetical protein CRUP_033065 [Coryphaenoides rupestris]|nr:hypothetical protein CRUP_033065 [Coryphaenoides rupestris]
MSMASCESTPDQGTEMAEESGSSTDTMKTSRKKSMPASEDKHTGANHSDSSEESDNDSASDNLSESNGGSSVSKNDALQKKVHCTACGQQVNQFQRNSVIEHPVLKVLICKVVR